jgi:hypothetical protein
LVFSKAPANPAWVFQGFAPNGSLQTMRCVGDHTDLPLRIPAHPHRPWRSPSVSARASSATTLHSVETAESSTVRRSLQGVAKSDQSTPTRGTQGACHLSSMRPRREKPRRDRDLPSNPGTPQSTPGTRAVELRLTSRDASVPPCPKGYSGLRFGANLPQGGGSQ